MRIGLHTTTANRTGGGYKGKGVHEAARIAALADGEQIVASRETAAAAPAGVTMSESRTVTLRGLSAPVEIVAIDWR